MRVRLLAQVTQALDNRKSPVSIKMLTGGKQYCCSFNPYSPSSGSVQLGAVLESNSRLI